MSDDMNTSDAMQDLIEKNTGLAYALQVADTGYWDIDLKTGTIALSDVYYSMLGYEPGEFEPSGEVMTDMIHPEDTEIAQKISRDYQEGKVDAYSIQYRIRKKNGDWAWVESRSEIVDRDEDGKPVRMIGVIWDISGRKHRQEETDMLSSAIDSIIQGVAFARNDRKIFRANTAIHNLFGYDAESKEMVGLDFNALFPEGMEDRVRTEIMPAIMQGGWRGETPGSKKDGSIIMLDTSITPVYDDQGEIIGTAGIVSDISERKASEEERAILESAIDTASTGIVIAGVNGTIVRANAAINEMLGHSADSDDLFGMNLDFALTDESKDIFKEEIIPAMEEGGWRGDLQLVTADTDIIDVDASISPVMNNEGEMVAIAAMVTDITEQREMEMILQEQNQAMMEMSTPVITLWDEIVMLPLVGTIDDDRAMQMTERLLEAIVGYEARVAILDVTGVAVIDTSVARNLLKAVDAASMLGAKVVVTGFSPSAAQTLAQLGVDFASLMTQGSLRAGIAQAFALVGQRVMEMRKNR